MIKDCGQAWVERTLHETPGQFQKLTDTDLWFLRSCYRTPESYYKERIKAVGFYDLERVLDAGCGFGQWSLGLAAQNNRVFAVDIDPVRVWWAARLAQARGLSEKIAFSAADLCHLPFPPAYLDAVFCYGVMMFRDENQVLAEFSRVLKPGGKLYATSTGMGNYLNFILRRALAERKLFYLKNGLKNICNTWLGHKDKVHYVSERQVRRAADRAGLAISHFQAEGTINFGSSQVKPIYQGRYFGALGVFDMLAVKK